MQSGGQLEWLVNGVPGGNASIGTIDTSGTYSAPSKLALGMNVTVTAAAADSPQSDYATAVASIISPAVVTATSNPQVAAYSIYLPAPGKVNINFGVDADYGLTTWVQDTPSPNGGEVIIYVAGMRAQTPYHMRAQVELDDGASFADRDHVFTTGTPPTTAPVSTSASNAQIPQAGIEMFDTLIPQEGAQAFATDLQGNVIWTYRYTDGTKMDSIQSIKLLPNGHLLILISYASSIALKGSQIPPNTVDAVREVDLAGNTIREVTQSELAAALSAKGYNFNLSSLHHDVLALQNGHWVLLASVSQSFNDLSGYPGTTDVLGDLVIDLDNNNQPVWVWNSFDHLDVNRHPYLFPDWTHSNALLYSTDDHSLLLSMRHQNWIIKIDYADGQGSGKVLWRLGEGGDFKIIGGTDPKDWFYAQHGPDFFSPNNSGFFRLGVMDNGDDRKFPGGIVCGATGSPPCYSAASVYQIDETAMTATLVLSYTLPNNLYSYFGGNVQSLANGDLKADFSAVTGGSQIQELNLNGPTPELVWQAQSQGTVQFRSERLASLYPGVQW